MCIRFANWACDRLTDDAKFGKKNHLFSWSSFWSGWVCKQAKLLHLGHKKLARIHQVTVLVRILVQRHNWSIFVRKWARRGRYSQWRPLSAQVERIFVQKNWRGGYWQHLVSTEQRYVPHSRSYTQCFAPCVFLKIALSAAELMSSDHLEAVIWFRWTIICGVPSKTSVTLTSQETIDFLKDNICDAIGEIQLHTIDNELKNWTDCVGYCMASWGSHLNEIIFHY